MSTNVIIRGKSKKKSSMLNNRVLAIIAHLYDLNNVVEIYIIHKLFIKYYMNDKVYKNYVFILVKILCMYVFHI